MFPEFVRASTQSGPTAIVLKGVGLKWYVSLTSSPDGRVAHFSTGGERCVMVAIESGEEFISLRPMKITTSTVAAQSPMNTNKMIRGFITIESSYVTS
jgi:hypothetical protein